ncbi:MAG: hypothetical protein FE834_09615, partial [Gammaproteobacteria bacterium]|nr:hypothetical protein [Gammaproteobacteria bacterium]
DRNETTPGLGIALSITDDKTDTVKGGETITYTFTFEEAVTGFDINDITISNGTKGTLTTVTNDTKYTLEVTPNTNFEGDLVVSVAKDAAADANGKKTLSASNTQAVDVKNPIFESAVINSENTTTLTLTFSEALTGVSDTSSAATAKLKAAGFSVTDDTTGSFVNNTVTKVIVAADGLTAVLTLTNAVTQGKTVKVTYDASDAGANAIKDKAGNALADVTTAITTTVADTTAPSITDATNPGSATIAKIGETLSVEIIFSESVKLAAGKTATITLVIDKADGGTQEVTATVTGATSSGTTSDKLTFVTATLANGLTDTNGIQIKANSLSVVAADDLTSTTNTPKNVNTNFDAITLSNSQVDTKAPIAPINLALANEDNSGLKSDNTTNHTNDLTITGEAEAGTTVQLYNAGTAITGATATVGSNERFSIDI